MEYIIGTDVGTTSTKSVLYDKKGQVIKYSNIDYPLLHTAPDAAEENPADILHAVEQTIKDVTKSIDSNDLIGISFSAAMHSLLFLDDKYHPLSNVYTWADNRAAKYLDDIKDKPLAKEIYQKTGTPIHPMSPLMKLIWLSKDNPGLVTKASWIVGIKEYIIYKLTGKLKTDYSMANATGFFNLHTFTWDKNILSLTKVEMKQLPGLIDTTAIVGNLTTEEARRLNLNTSVNVTMGASDGALSNIGVGAYKPGVAAITIGTSGAVRVVVNKPYLDPAGKLFCYYVAKNKWIIGGPVNNGGQIYQWVRDKIYSSEDRKISYDNLNQEVGQVPVGSHGLITLPYFSGERAPIWQAQAKGSLIGLNTNHTRADIAHSALEGIALNINEVLKLTNQAFSIKEIRATGGFTQSPINRQLLADVTGLPITFPDNFESSCLAAAVFGLKANHKISDINEIKNMIGTTSRIIPNENNHKKYLKIQKIYGDLNRRLISAYKMLDDLQNSI